MSSSGLQSEMCLPTSFALKCTLRKKMLQGVEQELSGCWLCAKLLHWFTMADLGQVTPFNASVPHLSNGGNNSDLPHRGVVRHCKSQLTEYLRVLHGGCLEPKSRFCPHWVVPRLELLSDLGKFSAPHPSSKLLVQMLTVFSWMSLHSPDLGCYGARHSVFLSCIHKKKLVWDLRALD